jgi:7-keto-8-aminopelargonate synthetase-like enzyme
MQPPAELDAHVQTALALRDVAPGLFALAVGAAVVAGTLWALRWWNRTQAERDRAAEELRHLREMNRIEEEKAARRESP